MRQACGAFFLQVPPLLRPLVCRRLLFALTKPFGAPPSDSGWSFYCRGGAACFTADKRGLRPPAAALLPGPSVWQHSASDVAANKVLSALARVPCSRNARGHNGQKKSAAGAFCSFNVPPRMCCLYSRVQSAQLCSLLMCVFFFRGTACTFCEIPLLCRQVVPLQESF